MLVMFSYWLPVIAAMSVVTMMPPKKKAKAKPAEPKKPKARTRKFVKSFDDESDDDSESRRKAAAEKTFGINGFVCLVM